MLKRDEETVAIAVADLQDVEEALREGETQEAMTAMRTALDRLTPLARDGISVAAAAHLLDVSTPTARLWVDRGILRPVPGSKPARLDVESVRTTRRLVVELRARGHDRDWVRALVDLLHDERERRRPEVRRGVDELRRGEIEPA